MSAFDPQLGGVSLVALRDAIVAEIRAHFPASADITVEKHRGKWTNKSLEHYSKETPCILVVYTGGAGFETTGNGKSRGDVTWTAFVATDVRDGDADDAALSITEQLLTLIPGSKFLPSVASASQSVTGLNAYVDALEEYGIDVHAVSWTQQVGLNKLTTEQLAARPEFLRLFTDLPMGGDDDPDAEHMNTVRDP